MPCNSDYLNPTRRETELRETAYLYAYVLRELGRAPIPAVDAAARDPYCKNDFVPELCIMLTNLQADADAAMRIMYDGRKKDARALAAWWERHQEADRRRDSRAKREARKAELIRSAKAKLTDEEWQAVISRS